ncbi:hypothetical protein [Actinoplanes sp. NBRC 103695]|uniref:hypothetical protein n=1 Tax=Actinoplanes sp. NBRC 103695 TaxID=3032202 RepID=UPI002552AE83|nr:hypothetical protein [Actinoplanes sp. NBRC 103695]
MEIREAPAIPPVVPESPPFPRRLTAFLVILGVLVLLVTTLKIVDLRYFRPGNTVVAFFEALADRDAVAAGALLSLPATDNGPLLKTPVLRSGGYTPPSGVRVRTAEVADDKATVEADFRLGDHQYQQVFQLIRDTSATAGVFYRWRIEQGIFPLDVGANGFDTISVAGVPTSMGNADYGTVTLAAYPGTYLVGLPEQPLWEAPDVEAHVGGGTEDGVSPALVLLAPSVKSGVREAADKRIRAHLDACAKKTVLAPAGCPFSSYSYADVRGIRWKITEYPRYELVRAEGKLLLDTTGYGSAKVSGGTVSGFGGTYPFSDSVSFPVTGTIAASGGTITYLPGDG